MGKAFKASDVRLQTQQHSGSAGRGERGGTMERHEDGGGRLRERSEEDTSCLLNSVACLLGAWGDHAACVYFLFIAPTI